MAESVKTGREQLKSGQLILAKRHWDFLSRKKPEQVAPTMD